MQYIVLILSIIVAIRTASYGIYEIKNNNNISRWNYRDTNCYCYFYLP